MRTTNLIRISFSFAVIGAFALAGCLTRPVAEVPLAWGDQGDGSYKNPVLNGDYSDPDIIRVGKDFYLVTSTFHLSPGVSVLHSKDLVNWRIIGHAFSDLSQFDKAYSADKMEHYGHGTWAPAIRYHGGKFWVYVIDPEFGLFMSTATNPAGPWTPAHHVKRMREHDDCCPFWDDDGQMYLSYADWHRGYRHTYDIRLCKMSADGRTMLDEGKVIHQGDSSEGTKIMKIKGLYYIFYVGFEKGVRMQMVMRSKNLYGPYEYHTMLQQRQQGEREPCQGGLVDAPDGSWWFIHHQWLNHLGRVADLQPVTWIDGWPIVGKVHADGGGGMIWQYRKPVQDQPILHPQSSDEFADSAIQPQWQWNHAPRNEKWSLAERPGFLRLKAAIPRGPGGFYGAANSLTQRAMGDAPTTATTRIEINGMQDWQEAGLCVAGNNAWMLQVVQEHGQRRVRVIAGRGGYRTVDGPALTQSTVWLRAESVGNTYHFSYSLDGREFLPIGDKFGATFGDWRGIRLGVFSFNTKADAGHIDVDWFHYEYGQSSKQGER